MGIQQMVSFVLRFYKPEDERAGHWRIKVTHVQGDEDIQANTLQEAIAYIHHVLHTEEAKV
ncbi:hypothetical protein [Ammoniphilus sp. CFH 90114]|uniref:hypothetical protein n=1 Tax=Ammoniphilus sp. CFH 90114 TaxID=2493665 RepID=UPI00100E22C1|nr:hypothetical protein [Ammoniphilus sp. CFH 90114]RXT04307.1 hypothetical protein EIZ39_20725 [Ammoniphilus sp. CFH 90114]